MYNVLKLIRKYVSADSSVQSRGEECPRIVIYGQYKTGTTACFLKVRNSLAKEPYEYFESQKFIPPKEEADAPMLAKVIVPPNPYLYADDRPLDEIDLPELQAKANQGLQTFAHFKKRIYLVRDPRDWIISGIIFLIQERPEVYQDDRVLSKLFDILRKKEEKPASISLLDILAMIYPEKDVYEFTAGFVQEQHRWLLQFEQEMENFVTLKYEDMIRNQIEHVENYLGLKLNGSADSSKRFGHVARTKSSGNWRDWMTDKDVEFFLPLFADYIARHNYDPEWSLNSVQKISPDHCSKYVKKVVQLKRDG